MLILENQNQNQNLNSNKKLKQPKIGLVRKDRIKETTIKENPHHQQFFTFKDRFMCLFCGGKNCKHEIYSNNERGVFITGLHSDLITNDIIASQRPSTSLIVKYNIIKQMKEKKIGMIINLQREGEHPYCGPNELEKESGFTYLPQDFISNGIDVLLCGWKDMQVPDSMYHMLNIVKEMHEVVYKRHRKVLIHCHAGYGRTGVLIACYMLFTSQKTVNQVVGEIRRIRKGCIQKKSQMEYCHRFYSYISKGRTVFSKERRQVDYYLYNQNMFMLEYELEDRKIEEYKHIPRLLLDVMDRVNQYVKKNINSNMKNQTGDTNPTNPIQILEIKGKENNQSEILTLNKNTNNIKSIITTNHIISITDLYNVLIGNSEWSSSSESLLSFFKNSINQGNWYVINTFSNLDIIIELVWDWLDESVDLILQPEKLILLFNENDFEKLINEKNDDKKSICNTNFKETIKKIQSYLNYNQYHILCFLSKFLYTIFNNTLENGKIEKLMIKFSVMLQGYGSHYYYDYYFNKDGIIHSGENSPNPLASHSRNIAYDNIILGNSSSYNYSYIVNDVEKKKLYGKVYSTSLLVRLMKFFYFLIEKGVDLGVGCEFN